MNKTTMKKPMAIALGLALATGFAHAAPAAKKGKGTPAEAKKFISQTEEKFDKLSLDGSRAAWVAQN